MGEMQERPSLTKNSIPQPIFLPSGVKVACLFLPDFFHGWLQALSS